MKPPPFSYHDPRTVDEALGLLNRLENAKVLAGGQSLMPMLNMRYVLPDHLIDLNKITALSYIRETDGVIEFGAMTRQRDIEFSDVVKSRFPIIHEAILNVGHRQTRNRGTIGGSLCHLDPSAELPVVAMAMDAQLLIRSTRGGRTIAMAQFPAGYMTSSLTADEMLCEIRLRPWPAGHGYAFLEFSRRKGDFAIVSVAALIVLDCAGRIARASLTLGGVGPTPLRMPGVEASLAGACADAACIERAAAQCARIDALSDPAVPAWYRQHLAAVLAQRALTKAVERAHAPGAGKDV